jgi:hypothetical protein
MNLGSFHLALFLMLVTTVLHKLKFTDTGTKAQKKHK